MNSFDLYFTPRAISSKTSPFYFIRISQSRYFLVAEKHLFEASFASKCKLFDKDDSDFYHKDLVRVYQKQNLALSWFKPASTLSSKYECWCEFEKDLKLLPLSNNERIAIALARVFLTELSCPFTRASVFIFCELMFFQICIDTWTLLLKYLWFCQSQRPGHSEALCAVNLRRFLALRLLWAMCKEKQFVKFDLSFTTLYATIAWLKTV